MRLRIAAAASLAALVTSFAMTASAEPVNIRIQWSVAPGHMTPLIPLAPEGVYKHYGKTYTVQPIRMRGSGPALQALAAGEIDFGGMSVQALDLGVTRAKLDLSVIAQVLSGGVEGYATNRFFVRADSPIKTFKDVKGRVAAVNAFGGTIDATIRAMAAKANLVPAQDFQVVEVRFPAMLPALESKRVDVAVLLTPFDLIADRKGGFRQLFTMRDALGSTETLQWIGKADWIAKNRAALVDFLEDNMRYRAWLHDPKNRQQAAEIISEVTKRPAKNYVGWVFSHKDNYRDPLARSDIARMQRNLDDLIKLGVLDKRIEIKDHVDLTIAEEAAKRL